MLKMKGKAKVQRFEGDRRAHGDGTVLGVVIKLEFDGVSSKNAAEFVGQIDLMFGKDDSPAMPEIGALTVTREVNNVEVHIGDIVIKGADLTKIKLTPIGGRKCDVKMEVSAQVDGVLDALHRYVGESALVTLTERQMELPKLQGGVAPEPQ